MKKIFLLASLAFSLSNAAFAQEEEPKEETPLPVSNGDNRAKNLFGAAFFVGLNAAQIDGDKLDGYNHLGLDAGVRAVIRFHPQMNATIDIAYRNIGAQRNFKTQPFAFFNAVHLDYLHVPVMIHYSDWKVQVGAGPYIGYLIDYKFIDLYNNPTTAFNNRLRNIDAGGQLSFSYFFAPKWAANISHTWSFADLGKNNATLFANYDLGFSRFATIKIMYEM